MKNIFCSFVVAGLFVACGGGSKPAPTAPTAAAAPTCDAAGANMVTQIGAENMDLSPDEFAAKRGELDSMVSNECSTTGWSEEARACLVAAADANAMKSCADLLTPEQQTSMGTNLAPAMGDDSAEGSEEGLSDEGMDEGGE